MEMIHADAESFDSVIKNNAAVLVDFWAEWCAPCKMMAPILNEVAEELPKGKQVGKVNIEKYQTLAQKFKVRSIPTLIFYKDGKLINKKVGFCDKKELLGYFN